MFTKRIYFKEFLKGKLYEAIDQYFDEAEKKWKHTRMDSAEEQWEIFWKEIVMDKFGVNLDQVKLELYDYSMLLENVPKVYMEVTGGVVSKPNADPDAVISFFNDYVQKTVDETIEDHDEEIGLKELLEAKKRLDDLDESDPYHGG